MASFTVLTVIHGGICILFDVLHFWLHGFNERKEAAGSEAI